MKNLANTFIHNQTFRRVARIVGIVFAVIFVLFVGAVIYRIPAAQERLKTQEAVQRIQSRKLTLADVLGQNLPPAPNPLLKDSTVEGVDVNENGIRDDVELAIFKLHPDSARIRAAELQYAMALQNELSGTIFNSETLVASMQDEGRGNLCIKDTVPARSASDSAATIAHNVELINSRVRGVEDLVINTEARKSLQKEIYQKFMTSYGDINDKNCDIDLKSLLD